MELNTASSVISFAKKLEEDSARFYENLAQRRTKDREILLSFAQENRKNIVQIERTYYGVISDALEGCFAFKINPDMYMLKTEQVDNADYPDALNQAVKIEEKLIEFYSDAAEQSKSLLADIPRIFTIVAKKRGSRIPRLESLLCKED